MTLKDYMRMLKAYSDRNPSNIDLVVVREEEDCGVRYYEELVGHYELVAIDEDGELSEDGRLHLNIS